MAHGGLANGTATATSGLRMSLQLNFEVTTMTWETPAYSDVRFGFEVTMYISNR
jgi:coenzyme PQQ precursor peptide PqqA